MKYCIPYMKTFIFHMNPIRMVSSLWRECGLALVLYWKRCAVGLLVVLALTVRVF